MARFDVYANPLAGERRNTPFFIDVQSDFIDGLSTRVVVPLRQQSRFGPQAQRLNPTLHVQQETLVLDTAALGAVPLAALKAPVLNLRDSRSAVLEALDALFGGY